MWYNAAHFLFSYRVYLLQWYVRFYKEIPYYPMIHSLSVSVVRVHINLFIDSKRYFDNILMCWFKTWQYIHIWKGETLKTQISRNRYHPTYIWWRISCIFYISCILYICCLDWKAEFPQPLLSFNLHYWFSSEKLQLALWSFVLAVSPSALYNLLYLQKFPNCYVNFLCDFLFFPPVCVIFFPSPLEFSYCL